LQKLLVLLLGLELLVEIKLVQITHDATSGDPCSVIEIEEPRGLRSQPKTRSLEFWNLV
jgi:hypothetical protein